MKKLRLLSIIVLAAGALLFNSCSQPEQHLKTIPSTAKMVGSVDLMGLAMKADLSDPTQYGFYNDMMEKLKEEKPEMHSMIEEMTKNPMQTGIKYREDLYFFLQPVDGKDIFALTMSLRSGDKFGKFLADVSKMAEGIEFTLENKDGINLFYNNDMTIAWDDARALIIPENAYLEENGIPFVKGLFNQGEAESIVGTDYFGQFKANKKDLSIMMEPAKLMAAPQMAMLKSQMPFNMEGNIMNLHFGFEKDEIILKLNWVYNEEMVEMMKNFKFVKDEFDSKLLKYLPKENYMSMAVAINPEEYYNWIMTLPTYKSMLSNADANSPIKIDEVIKGLKGDILIGMHGLDVEIDESSSTDPEGMAKKDTKVSAYGTIVLSLNNEDLYKKITTQLIPPGMFKEENGYFYGQVMGEDLYYGLYDNNIVVTNDKKVIEKAPNGGFEESLADNDAAKILKYPAAIYLNLLWDTYPEILQKTASEEMDNRQLEIFQSLTNVLQEIDAYTPDAESSEVHIKMRNTDKNSLRTILMLIDENRKNF